MVKPSVASLVVLATMAMALFTSCHRHGFRIRHQLLVERTGFKLDGQHIDSSALADSLKPFCAEKNDRHQWQLEATKEMTSKDFVEFLGYIAKINTDCRGLFGLGHGDPPVMLQPPVPYSRTNYTLDQRDTLRPRLSMMVVASRKEVKFWTSQEWLPEIPVVQDTSGMDYVATGKPENPVRHGWIDYAGRCLVEARKDQCTDSVWNDVPKYVLLGDLSLVPDTVHPKESKQMEQVVRVPLRRDVMIAAEIHALRTLPGTLPDTRARYHGLFAPDMSWDSIQRLIIALRKAGVDFSTVELAS